MNTSASLPPLHDRETSMLKVARELAIGIYELDDILKNCNVGLHEFEEWKRNPRFLEYLKSERDAWNSAVNAPERIRLKSTVVLEEFLTEAYSALHDRSTPLNQRVELGKLLAKMAGIGETKVIGGGSGFQLTINIGDGKESISIRPQMQVIDGDYSEGE